MKKILLFSGLLLLVSCAESQVVTECVEGRVYGFWYGLWHGIIAPFSFFVSLMQDDVAMYAVNNNGDWYNFGFILGVGGLTWGGNSSNKYRK